MVLLATLVALLQSAGAALQEPALPGPWSSVLASPDATGSFEARFVESSLVTVHVESLDFDAAVRVEDAAGQTLVSDLDSGLETNARATFRVEGGVAYSILVESSSGAGEYTVRVQSGSPEDESQADQLDRGIVFRKEAAQRALARGDVGAAGSHRLTEGRYRISRSEYREALEAFEAGARHAGDAGDLASEARCWNGVGIAHTSLGQLEEARRYLDTALEIYADLDDVVGQARVSGNIANSYHAAGDLERAREFRARQVELARQGGDHDLLASGLYGVATMHLDRGELGEAEVSYLEALRVAREAGVRRVESYALLGLATIEERSGSAASARVLLEQALASFEHAGSRSAAASTRVNLARACQDLGDFEAAERHLAAAVETAEELDEPMLASWALVNLAILNTRQADYPRAREIYLSRAMWIERLGNPIDGAWNELGLAEIDRRIGNLASARERLDQLRERTPQLGIPQLEAHLDREQGLLDLASGNIAAAIERMSSALRGYERLDDDVEAHLSRAALGLMLLRNGESDESRQLLEEAYSAFEAANRPRDLAQVQRYLGIWHMQSSEFGRARELFEAALDLWREYGFPFAVSTVLGDLGQLEHVLGDYAASRVRYEEALQGARASGARGLEAKQLQALADLHQHLGNLERAESLATESVTLARPLGDAVALAESLLVLTSVLLDSGEPSRARSAFEELEELSSAMGELLQARLEGVRAFLLRSEGNLEAAVLAYESRARRAREAGTRLSEASALGSLASLDYRLGRSDLAAEHAHAALALLETVEAQDQQLAALRTLAWIALDEGSPERAAEAVIRAERILARSSLRHLETDDLGHYRARYSSWGAIAQDAVSLRSSQSQEPPRDIVEAGFRSSGRWKGHALLQGIVEHRTGGRNAEAMRIKGMRKEALARRDMALVRLAECVAEESSSDALAILRDEVREEEELAERLARDLADISPRDASLDTPVGLDSETVRRALLSPGTVLVEFAEGRSHLYAYVLTNTRLNRVELAPLTELEAILGAWLEGITDPYELGDVQEVVTAGRLAYERLLAPVLAAAGTDVERLLIVPSAIVSGVPFDALVVEGGAASSFADVVFAIDSLEITYGPSVAVLVELAENGARSSRGRVLILADPRYASEAPSAGRPPESAGHSLLGMNSRSLPSTQEWTRLEKTRGEALALAGLLVELGNDEAAAAPLLRVTQERDGSAHGQLFDLYMGADASRERLGGDLRGYSVLHLAMHGFVDPDSPGGTGLVLSWRPEDDGYVTVGDVLEFDLDANLVVLSACETARGRVQRGEGVQSLARAFLYSGARAAIASLWQVSDWAAAETMTAFYRSVFQGGAPTWSGLRAAKMEVRRRSGTRGLRVLGEKTQDTPVEAAHPYFWAPFVFIGVPSE